MHTLIRREDIDFVAALPDHSAGLTRNVLLGAHTGTTHTGLTLVELESGHVDAHLHSFESSFYVLSGEPTLYLDGHAVRLKPGACGAIPVGSCTPGAARALRAGSRWPRRVPGRQTRHPTRSSSARRPTRSRSRWTSAIRATATSSCSRRTTWTSTG